MNKSIEYQYLSAACKSKQYTFVAVCFHSNQTDSKTYIKYIQSRFDGVVIVDISQDTAVNFEVLNSDSPKLLAYIKSVGSKNEILKFIADSICCNWLLLLYDNEILHIQRHLCENTNLLLIDEKKIYQINMLYTPDNDSYYKIKGHQNGVAYIDRIYHTSLLFDYKYSIDAIECNVVRENTPIIIIYRPDFSEYSKLNINIFTETSLIYGLYYKDKVFYNYSDIQTEKLESEIHSEVQMIGDFLIQREEMLADWSLHSGEAGIALLFAQLYLDTKDERYYNQLIRSLNYCIQAINHEPNQNYAFYYKLANFGWLLCYIKKHQLIDIDEDYLVNIDEILKRVCLISNDFNWWHINGRLSIARYFMKRGILDVVEQELYALNQYASLTDSGLNLDITINGVGSYYDLGLKKGLAGVLYFLSKCIKLNVGVRLAQDLGRKIMSLYSEVEIQHTSMIYPNVVETRLTPKIKTIPRFAWCYGSPGILYSMYMFFMHSKDDKQKEMVLNKLILIAKERKIVENKIYDAMICYGSAGLVQIYNRMYIFTKNQIFRDAALFWIKVSVNIGKDESYQSRYKFWVPDAKDSTREVEDFSLLKGLSGVGLVFLSTLNTSNINWDESINLY